MTIAIFSILIFTGIIWILNKKLPVQICPLCAGVSLTWILIFFGMFFEKLSIFDYQLPTAILAGGTIAGLMSKLEKFIKLKFILIWKTVFVVSGFMAVYGLVTREWTALVVSMVVNIIVTFLFKKHEAEQENQKSEKVKELEKKMESCC